MYNGNHGNAQRILHSRPVGLYEVGRTRSRNKGFFCGDTAMIIFHRTMFVGACILSFMAGALSAGAQEIASQRMMTQVLLVQPISVLTEIQVGGSEL